MVHFSASPSGDEPEPVGRGTLFQRLRDLVVGPARDLGDEHVFHRITLVAVLAWIGLGADGLSSSSYGPEEAFRTLGPHTYLAVGLAGLTALTVAIIGAAYSYIIEDFPNGGGGYVVAGSLLGPRWGVLSGCALLVDYAMTITVSIASAGDALYSYVPGEWHGYKLVTEALLVITLTVMNLRGVRESVLAMAPIFIVFVVTHVLVIVGGVLSHAAELPALARSVHEGFQGGLATLGLSGLLLLFLHAYALGGGTYTGIEAVSNGLPIMREPRVQTGKRTMLYMGVSLAFTAGGLLLCYLLWHVVPQEGRTLNAVLLDALTRGLPFGAAFAVVTILSEGALLVVAAQAGFIDGPRVLANLAMDSWMPRGFAALSERLTTANGVLLMGVASLVALLGTHGDIHVLVVMYSINVFLTFSLSMLGMARSWWRPQQVEPWRRRFALFAVGFMLCSVILVVTVAEKFGEGGWVTVSLTAALVLLCFCVQRHYATTGQRIGRLFGPLEGQMEAVPLSGDPPPLDPSRPTAALLVGGYGGLGIHTVLTVLRTFPGYFHNLVFLSVGTLDTSAARSERPVDELRERTLRQLERYERLAARLGLPATSRHAIGTDLVEDVTKLCLQLGAEFPNVLYVGGKLVFQEETWYHRLLHNDAAHAVQRRLQLAGKSVLILPARL